MTLRFVFESISGDWTREMDKATAKIARCATGAIRDAADLAKQRGRASIASGGFSLKWQNALHADIYPKKGVSLSPAAVIRHKIPYADVFEYGLAIAGKPLLWMPLSNVPVLAGGRRMSPSQFVERIGVLYTMKVPGKQPMLGAVVRMTDARASKGISLSLLRRGRNPHGRGTVRLVPLYVGVPNVNDPKKFGVLDAIRQAAAQVPQFYVQEFEHDNG